MEHHSIHELEKPDLQDLYSIVVRYQQPRAIGFQSVFDEQIFGEMNLFIHSSGRVLVWDKFYPFGEIAKGFRSDLQGLGLGTYAHTAVLLHLAEFTRVVRGATIRAYGAETGFPKILARAGVPDCAKKDVSFEDCLRGSLRSCEEIGFQVEKLKARFEAVLEIDQ